MTENQTVYGVPKSNEGTSDDKLPNIYLVLWIAVVLILAFTLEDGPPQVLIW